jgi:hypothetical protein
MHVLSDPTSISSGDQLVASPLNSGGLPTVMSGFAPAATLGHSGDAICSMLRNEGYSVEAQDAAQIMIYAWRA